MSLLVKPGQDKIRERYIPLHCLVALIVQDRKNVQSRVEGTICCKQVAINIVALKCILRFLHAIGERGCAGPLEVERYHCLDLLVDCIPDH